MVLFNIIFDRSDRTYNPGDVVNLDIRVQVNSDTKFRSVYVRLQGYAHVEWTESRQVRRNGKSHTKHTTYHSHETYFKNYQTLAGAEGGSDGHIRYEAKVHMDIPWGFDKKETVPFYLRPRFNLNEFPHLREPLRSEARKAFGCCCWASDPLHICNALPQSGFVPGDRTQYSLELNNNSEVSIYGANVRLTEKVVYHAYSPRSKTREDRRTLWEHEFSGRDRQLVAALQNKIFSTDLYFDPGWKFRFFDGCGIITVEYYIKSEARVSGCHTNLDNYSTITMGTVPLSYGGPQSFMAPMIPMPFPSAPIDNSSAPPAEPISEQPLPSYKEMVSKPSASVNGLQNNMETPPPTFTEVELMNKKEKQ